MTLAHWAEIISYSKHILRHVLNGFSSQLFFPICKWSPVFGCINWIIPPGSVTRLCGVIVLLGRLRLIGNNLHLQQQSFFIRGSFRDEMTENHRDSNMCNIFFWLLLLQPLILLIMLLMVDFCSGKITEATNFLIDF